MTCPTEVADETAAAELAASCGREVEVLAERTEWQTVHALPDGLMRLDTSMAAQRTRVSGEWAEIDTTLVETSGGVSADQMFAFLVSSATTDALDAADRIRSNGGWCATRTM